MNLVAVWEFETLNKQIAAHHFLHTVLDKTRIINTNRDLNKWHLKSYIDKKVEEIAGMSEIKKKLAK